MGTRETGPRRAALAGGLILGGVLLATGAGPRPAEAATLIRSCPVTITTSGEFVLASNLFCFGTAITVQANNVKLVLGRRTLTGNGTGDGVAASGVSGLQIVGGFLGAVRNFEDGIDLDNVPGVRISSVTATGNTDDGLDLENSQGARISGNRANGNGDDGIRLINCDNCTINGNQANNNGDDGIEVNDTVQALIEGNTANGNGEDGLDLATDSGSAAGSDNNTVSGNTTNGNNDEGIEVDIGSTGNRFNGNRSNGNVVRDMDDENLPACVNTWTANNFATDTEGNGPGAGCIR